MSEIPEGLMNNPVFAESVTNEAQSNTSCVLYTVYYTGREG